MKMQIQGLRLPKTVILQVHISSWNLMLGEHMVCPLFRRGEKHLPRVGIPLYAIGKLL